MTYSAARKTASHREKLLTQEEVSEWLRIPVRQLEDMRCRPGKDPIPFVKIGRKPLYPEHLVQKWLERHTYYSTQEYFESNTG